MRTNGVWSLVKHYMIPIESLFDIEGVTEISVNRFDEIYLERFDKREKVDTRFEDEEAVATLISQIAVALGQTVHKDTHPVLDARLIDGTRVCGVLYPTSTRGSCISFRLFPKKRITGDYLIKHQTLTKEMLEFFKLSVVCRSNMLVGGNTGSGKTTLLNILSGFIPEDERVLTVEDTKELQVFTKNLVSLEAPTRRKPGDSQTVDMAFLIKTGLRKNPNRIIVGEIRDAKAAIAFLHAINTGHTACSTIHANSSVDSLLRIQTLVAGEGTLPFDVVKSQVRSNLNIIVHVELTPNQGRRVTSITEIVNGTTKELWTWSYRKACHVKKSQESEIYRKVEKFCL